MDLKDNTPIVMLTVKDLKEVLNLKKDSLKAEFKEKRYVYGLKGIRELFKVSHATAQRYKNTFLKDAISQQGRKIIIDVDKARELFNKKFTK